MNVYFIAKKTMGLFEFKQENTALLLFITKD